MYISRCLEIRFAENERYGIGLLGFSQVSQLLVVLRSPGHLSASSHIRDISTLFHCIMVIKILQYNKR